MGASEISRAYSEYSQWHTVEGCRAKRRAADSGDRSVARTSEGCNLDYWKYRRRSRTGGEDRGTLSAHIGYSECSHRVL